MEKIVEGFLSKIGEYLAEATINQGRYLCCFNNIVEDLKEEERKLISAERHMKKEVEKARNNTIVIDDDVKKWLSDASEILAEVQILNQEIEVKKSCLNGWCPNWGCTYWLGRKATKKTIIMKRAVENGEFKNLGEPAPLPDDIEFSPPEDFEFFKSSKFAFEQIIEALTNNQINLVGLYGMGGTGKTTLAKAVGEKVKGKMFDKVIMAVISQTPNFEDIQAHLAQSLDLKLEEKTKEDRAKRLYKRFTEAEDKILLILDDVWENLDLKILKSEIGISFDSDSKGCKVLLTTRQERVCITLDCKQRIQLNVLEEKEGLALLKRHARIVDDDSGLNAVASQVARECGGLPLALVAIGLALKEQGIDDWKVMREKLIRSKLEDIPNSIVAGEKGIYATLRASYDYLKGEKTKPCFLLCSLFPEDHAIRIEELVWYAMGLGWYQEYDLIEDSRRELLSTVRCLKASGLLLDAKAPGYLAAAGEEYVKMHDMVRDVALWIASKGENVFMSKVGMGQIGWSKEEDWERYTAISLMANKIEELSIGLVCPKLEILILGGESKWKKLKVSDECFEEMKGLKVLSLTYVDFSLKSLQFLMNLKTLRLSCCNTRDISYLGKLNRLEILLFDDPPFDELPREISELRKLRLFYLDRSVRIPSNVLQKCSKLEELYTLNGFFTWVFKENNTCLPEDLAFPKLQRYVICVNTDCHKRSYKRALEISNIQAVSLKAFKALYGTLDYLRLERVTGCQNILPSIDQGGFNELKEAYISACDTLQEVFQLEGLRHAGKEVSRRLAKLELVNLPMLRHIWKGPIHHVNLQSLTYLRVDSCDILEHIFPISIARGLVRLEELTITNAPRLKQVFYMDHAREEIIAENDGKDIELPKLRILILERLESLTSFLPKNYHSKYPMLEEVHISECPSLTTTSFISTKLQVLKIKCCPKLRHVFSCNHARNLLPLEELSIEDCEEMEYVIVEDNEEDHSQPLLFPNLRKIKVNGCGKLKYLFPISITQHLQQLESIEVQRCDQLEKVFEDKDGVDVMNDKEIILPQLKEFTLFELPSLTNFGPMGYHFILKLNSLHMSGCNRMCAGYLVIYPDPAVVICGLQRELRSLEAAKGLCKLYLIKSYNLKHIFSSNLAQDLVQLKELYIISCEELEQIIVEDEINHVQTPFFPNLSKIDVRGCNKLKHLFPVNIAAGLQQLESINVRDCDQLQKVFGHENGADDTNDKEIVLPQLKELSLSRLPSLTDFGPVDYQFILKLASLGIRRCDQMFPGYRPFHDGPTIVIYGLQHELRSLEEAENLLGPQSLFALYIIKCLRLKHIFSSNLARDLLQLEELYIINCEELEQIIVEDEKNHIQTPFFPNLSIIDVHGCNKLKHLFPLNIAADLQQLESINVKGCDQLQKVFGPKNGVDDMNDEEIVLPQLKELSFKELPNLTNFGPVGYRFSMQLKSLIMEGCNDELWKSYFGDWEDLSIDSFKVTEVSYNQENITVRFQRDGRCKFTISDVNKSDLSCVTDPLGLGFTLRNLSNLRIHECHKMGHIFSSNLAQDLLQLRRLNISNCEELKQIIVEDGEDDHIQTSFFPNLQSIHISGCNKLKYVFPITMVRGLQNLEWISLEECDQLEKVFIDGDNVIDDKEVVFSPLVILKLEKLPRLTNFCSPGYHCIFPSLSSLGVKDCPNIATRFSRGEGRSVHAECKPPNQGGKDGDQPTIIKDIDSLLLYSKGSPSSRKQNGEET